MKRSRVVSLSIIAACLIAASVALFPIVRDRIQGTSSGGSREFASAATRQYAVRVATARRSTIVARTTLNGEVVPESSVEALPDVAGTVSNLTVDVGDRVAAGAIVGYVDPSRPGARFQASPVTAPISGTVTAIFVDLGSTVSTATPIVQIGTLDDLEIVVDLPERFVGAITLGGEVTVTFSAFPDRPRVARTSRISPVFDPSSRSQEIAFVLSEPWDLVRAGMFAEVALATERREDVVTVPAESIVRRGTEDAVFIVEGESARLVRVQTGLIAGGNAEIVSGLLGGEQIVVEGQNLLEDGSAVRVVDSVGGAAQ